METEDRIKTLAEFLDVDPEDIEESGYSDNTFTVNPRMAKEGAPPEHYKTIIEKFKILLTPLKIQQITDFINGKRIFPKMRSNRKERRDRLYYSINQYLKRYKQDKPEYIEVKEACLYVQNVLYHLLSNEDKDYIRMYKDAFLDKPLTDNRKLVERDDGGYMVLTDEEADEKAKEYIKTSLWAFNADFICRMCGLPYAAEEMIRSFQGTECEGANDTILALIENADGIDFFVEQAINADGRGHFLNTYDGEEHEIKHGNEWLYIYKVN